MGLVHERGTADVGKEKEEQEFDLDILIDVKGWKAIGNKLSSYPVLELGLIESVAKVSEPEEETDTIGETDPKEETDTSEGEEDLEIGSTVEFKIKKDEDKDQLGLF